MRRVERPLISRGPECVQRVRVAAQSMGVQSSTRALLASEVQSNESSARTWVLVCDGPRERRDGGQDLRASVHPISVRVCVSVNVF
jgi:hypothetical protein